MDPNAGTAPKPRRKPLSPARCLLWSCSGLGILVVLLFFGTIVYGMIQGGRMAIKNARDPHFDRFNASSPAGEPPVRPLVDLDTKFDIALTIWARVPNPDSSVAAEHAQDQSKAHITADWGTHKSEGVDLDPIQKRLEATAAAIQRPVIEVMNVPEEKVIFHQVLFEGISLREKVLEKAIQYELPLERLYVASHRSARCTRLKFT